MATVPPPTHLSGSAYPAGLADLLPRARKLAADLGQVPARNRLMKELHIGAPKATALREHLAVELVDAQLADTDAGPDADPWAYAEPAGPDLADLPPLDESLPAIVPAPSAQVSTHGHPDTPTEPTEPAPRRQVAVWPIVLLALPAFVAVWSGWVGLGRMTGFGMVDLLPGIVESGGWATIDSAITLPIGVETYAAYALYVWLSGRVPDAARRFARISALGSLAVGALGQVAYHLLAASGAATAPWPITMAVSCLPVAVLGMGAALAHLVRAD